MSSGALPSQLPLASVLWPRGRCISPVPITPLLRYRLYDGHGRDGRLMLGWQSKPGTCTTHDPGEHYILVEMESFWSITVS